MMSRLCFWKPAHISHDVILPSSSDDLDGVTMQEETCNALQNSDRSESLNSRNYLHKRNSVSTSSSSNQPSLASAKVLATAWNEVECTNSDNSTDASLGSKSTANQDDPAASRDDSQDVQSIQSTILTVSFDGKDTQVLIYSRDDQSEEKSCLVEESCLDSFSEAEEKGSLYEKIDSYQDAETNDGYKADDDENSGGEDDDDFNTGSLDEEHDRRLEQLQFISDAESLAWQTETDMTRILHNYGTMCCTGQDSDDSSDSSVWSKVR